MNVTDFLLDLANRPLEPLIYIDRQVLKARANEHPGGHDNSITWLIWHSGRELDVQLADLSGDPEVWVSGGFRNRLALGELGDTVGYRHSAEQARALVTDDVEGLIDYLAATLDAFRDYVRTLSEEALDEIIDRSWDPPVTRGVRLVSAVEDASQHIAQVAYIAGMKTL